MAKKITSALCLVLGLSYTPIFSTAHANDLVPEHPAHVQAFLGVCIDAVLLGRDHISVSQRIGQHLGDPVDPHQFKAFLPDDDSTAWSFNSPQGSALVLQPKNSASCHISLTSGTTDLAVEFFEEYVKNPPPDFSIAYDEVQPILNAAEEQTHWVRVVVWSLPSVPTAGLMTTLLVPSEGSSDRGLIGVMGTELVKTTLSSKPVADE